MEKITGSIVSRNFPTGIPTDVQNHDSDNNDGEELTMKELIRPYRTMHQKFLQIVKVNEKLTKQIAQLNIEKNDRLKNIMLLEGNLIESRKIQGDPNGELEHMKKSIWMLNSSSKLDKILTVRKAAGAHVGLSYKAESSCMKTVFVKASQVKKPEVIQRKSGSRTRTPSKKWIPTCHYCEYVEHIRPHCFQHLADLRRMGYKKPQCWKSTKQVWVSRIYTVIWHTLLQKLLQRSKSTRKLFVESMKLA